MPGLTLVTGGPASGKTERLLEVAAARYHNTPFADTLVLVPTARHADQFRQRLVTEIGVAVGLDVTTLGLFARRVTSDAPVVANEVARELLARVTVERAEAPGPARRFAAIARTPGLHALLRTAIADLAASTIAPEVFAQHATRTGDPDLLGIADLYASYMAALHGRGWYPPEGRAAIAAARVMEQPPAALVLVDGAQFLQPGEVLLVAALASTSEVWCALDPHAGERARWTLATLLDAVPAARVEFLQEPAAATDVHAFTTADAEAQLREIARSIKQRLAEDPTLRPSDIAVTVRRVGPYLAAARRLFGELDLPLDPAAGERLAERPFGVWALRALRLGVHGWRLLDVLDVCASGFCAAKEAGFEPGALGRLRRIGRRHLLWSGLDALRRIPEAAQRGEDEAEPPHDRMVAASAAWARTLDRLEVLLNPEELRTPAQHAALLDGALFGADGLVRTTVEDEPTLAVEVGALRAELATLRAVDEALGATPVSFSAFVDLLERRMQRPTTLIREAGGVLLAPMHTLHGLRFRHVYVAGLTEGEFPAPARSGGLLDRDARQALADTGLMLPPEPRATEDELWLTAVSRAGTTSLWHPRFDTAGRPAPASYYLVSAVNATTAIPSNQPPEVAASVRELAVSLTRRWPADVRRPAAMTAWDLVVAPAARAEQRRRSFAGGGRHEGYIPGADTARIVHTEVQWSASRLESYRTCPFQFFGRYALRLDELDQEQSEADAATRGLVMHEMLEDALAPLAASSRPLDGSTLEEVIGRLRTHGRAIWDDAPRKHAFGRVALWRHEADTIITRLEELLRRELEATQTFGMTSVAGGERRFVGPLPGVDPPLLLLAQVDRVDLGEGAIQVVDYKTGSFIGRSEVDNGRRLQLQLYALIAGAELGATRLIARYAFVRPGSTWWLDSAQPNDRAALELAATIASGIRDDVTAGHFQVAPLLGECPTWCAARTICRVNHFSRAKTWT